MVELAGVEPASFGLASEASPGAAGDLMSGPRRSPARYANPSLIDFPLGTQALPRGEACFTTPLPQRRHLRGDGYLVLARQQVRHCRHLYFFPTFDGDPGTPARFFRLDRSKSKPCSPICVFQELHCTAAKWPPEKRTSAPSSGAHPRVWTSRVRLRVSRATRACRSASCPSPPRSRPSPCSP